MAETEPAFVIRYDGTVYAYVNRCAHVSVELDWIEGEFFDLTGLYLICSTHGATYLPESGRCVARPVQRTAAWSGCRWRRDDGKVYLVAEQSRQCRWQSLKAVAVKTGSVASWSDSCGRSSTSSAARRWGIFFKSLTFLYLFVVLFLALGWFGGKDKALQRQAHGVGRAQRRDRCG